MRALIIPDKFKGTLSASAAADAIADGLRLAGITEIIKRPLADGGEGSHDTLIALDSDLTEKSGSYTGCNGQKIRANYIADAFGNVFLETAKIIGLTLPGSRDSKVLNRSTFGVGEWIMENAGAKSISLFLGGSATVDGGFGLARALGFEFLDNAGNRITEFAHVDKLSQIKIPIAQLPEIFAFTDVKSILTGQHGSTMFAKQKGADLADVSMIEDRLEKIRKCWIASGCIDVNSWPGSGAAGGLAAPLIAHPAMNCTVASGIDFFLKRARVEETIQEFKPDIIVTGEGCTDSSTLEGKVVMGVWNLAQKYDIHHTVVCGIARDRELLAKAGLRVLSTVDVCGDVPTLNAETARERLIQTAQHIL